MLQVEDKRGSKNIFHSSSVQLSKNNRTVKLDNFDVVAITEWLSNKSNNEELFSSLRAIALLCNVIEGFEEVFFSVAKELPNNLSIKNPTIDEIREAIGNIDKEIADPFDYIKALQNIFKYASETETLISSMEENFLSENLSIINKKMKLVPIENGDSCQNEDIMRQDIQSPYSIEQTTQVIAILDALSSLAPNYQFLKDKQELHDAFLLFVDKNKKEKK